MTCLAESATFSPFDRTRLKDALAVSVVVNGLGFVTTGAFVAPGASPALSSLAPTISNHLSRGQRQPSGSLAIDPHPIDHV